MLVAAEDILGTLEACGQATGALALRGSGGHGSEKATNPVSIFLPVDFAMARQKASQLP